MIAKIVLASLFFAQALAEESPAYQFTRSIIQPEEGRQVLLGVTLDNPIYAVSAPGYIDLRLVDQDGIETPYLLQKITSKKTVIHRLPSRSVIQSLRKTGDDGIAVTINLDKDATNADGLTLITKQRDFEYDIQINGSSDGQNWHTLVENAAIYDYSRYMAIGNRDIDLPDNSFRHFKIVVAQASQTRAARLLEMTRTLRGDEEQQRSEKLDLHKEPLHIERIDFWYNQSETIPEAETQFDYPIAQFQVSQDAKHQASLIDIDTERQPLTGFTLKIDTPNFSRNAEVQIPTKRRIEPRMQSIGNARLEALHFQDINREQTTIRFSEQRQQHYRIVIQNQDSPPLEISAIKALGIGYQLLFLPQPGNSYRLLYGTEEAEPGHYDTEPIRELLRRGFQSTAAVLGPETAGAPVAESLGLGKLLNSKLFLVVAIALMVLVLAWSLYRIGKKVGELPE